MRISQKVKGVFKGKSSTYYFHMKTKILVDFQISISVRLRNVWRHWMNFKISEITNDNQKANRKINCDEKYPTHQSTLS